MLCICMDYVNDSDRMNEGRKEGRYNYNVCSSSIHFTQRITSILSKQIPFHKIDIDPKRIQKVRVECLLCEGYRFKFSNISSRTFENKSFPLEIFEMEITLHLFFFFFVSKDRIVEWSFCFLYNASKKTHVIFLITCYSLLF